MYTVVPLALADCLNARDLAGLPLSGGARLAARALYRSDMPAGPDLELARRLAELNVSRVVDLRSRGEARLRPSPVAGLTSYRLVPLVDPRVQQVDGGATLAEVYRGALDLHGATIAAGVAAVADAPPGAVLVHCAAGKDRTGILVALLLRLAGAADEEIAADYALSQRFLADYFAAELATIPDPAERSALAERQHSRRENILGLLERLDQRHGGAEAYLRARGVTDEQLAAIRSRLRGTPGPAA